MNIKPTPAAILTAVFELAKPRILVLVTVVALTSYWICGGQGFDLGFWKTLGAVTLLSAGIFTLNQWMERDQDAQMVRTRDRPIPSGRLGARGALVWGLGLTFAGLAFSFFLVNLLMGLVALFTAVGYLFVYTPLKYRSVFHTALGALPGATPPLAGSVAAAGSIDPLGWVLFAVLFFWQFPHFLSIEMIYKDDYRKSGTLVLPVVEPDGKGTAFQVIGGIAALGAVTAVPFLLGRAGLLSLVLLEGAAVFFLFWGIRAVVTGQKRSAKHLLRVSVAYLPLVLLILVFHW